MLVDALTKEMDMHKDMKEVLMEGNIELENEGINKVLCIDEEIRMTKIRNRDMKELPE